jgi:hypothetical protein
MISSNPRAQKEVHCSKLLRGSTDLPKLNGALSIGGEGKENAAASDSSVSVHLVQSDTLDAAQKLHVENPKAKIAVLNMASPLQPGGGVLRAQRRRRRVCVCVHRSIRA